MENGLAPLRQKFDFSTKIRSKFDEIAPKPRQIENGRVIDRVVFGNARRARRAKEKTRRCDRREVAFLEQLHHARVRAQVRAEHEAAEAARVLPDAVLIVANALWAASIVKRGKLSAAFAWMADAMHHSSGFDRR